jgi:hypothetical protein
MSKHFGKQLKTEFSQASLYAFFGSFLLKCVDQISSTVGRSGKNRGTRIRQGEGLGLKLSKLNFGFDLKRVVIKSPPSTPDRCLKLCCAHILAFADQSGGSQNVYRFWKLMAKKKVFFLLVPGNCHKFSTACTRTINPAALTLMTHEKKCSKVH